jgi:hypothetical protein
MERRVDDDAFATYLPARDEMGGERWVHRARAASDWPAVRRAIVSEGAATPLQERKGQWQTVVRDIKRPNVGGGEPPCSVRRRYAAPPRRNARPVSGQCGAHLPLGAESRNSGACQRLRKRKP